MTIKAFLMISSWITFELILLALILSACIQSCVDRYFEAQYKLIKRITGENLRPPPISGGMRSYDKQWQ